MKRIIDGATYNTDTATVIAEGTQIEDGRYSGVEETTESTLYQTPSGIYFIVDEIETPYQDRNGERQIRTRREWFVANDADQARQWCEKFDLDLLRDIEDMPPEAATSESASATITVRLPPALKSAIDERAKTDGMSINAFALRCFERCLGPQDITAKG